jgi:hypothetical protein
VEPVEDEVNEFRYIRAQANLTDSATNEIWTFDHSFYLREDVEFDGTVTGSPVLPLKVFGKLKHWKDGSERRYAVDSNVSGIAEGVIWLSGLYFDPFLNEGRDREDYEFDPLVLESRDLDHCLLTIRLCSETEFERVKAVLGLSSSFYSAFDERFQRLKSFLQRELNDVEDDEDNSVTSN